MVYVRFARKFLGRSIFRIVEFLVVWVLVCKGYVILAATTVPSSEASVYSVWVGIFAGRLSQRISEKRPYKFSLHSVTDLQGRWANCLSCLQIGRSHPTSKASQKKTLSCPTQRSECEFHLPSSLDIDTPSCHQLWSCLGSTPPGRNPQG